MVSSRRLLVASSVLSLFVAGCADSNELGPSGGAGPGTGPGPGGVGGGEGGSDVRPSSTSSGFGGEGGASGCTEEVCDGVDNDCDGEVDEGCDCITGDTQPCYTGPTGTQGVGACTDGTQTCDDLGKWGECTGEVLPSDEVCDGADNDCNGETDEIVETLNCGQGVCATSVQSCVNGQPQQCVPLTPPSTVEQCDGVDDNCNGQVDEGCSCVNGSTQSCYTGPESTLNVGPCRAGTQTCANGAWGACMGQVLPTTEICDAIDQNCDGNVNQGACSLPNATSTCGGASGCQLGACNAGYSNCDMNAANGCEVRHSDYSNSSFEFLGAWDADSRFGSGCPLAQCEGPILTRTGTQGRFFTIDAREASTCAAYVSMAFELSVPAGVDYDLYVGGTYCNSDPSSGASTKLAGQMEEIVVWCDDVPILNDSFWVDIEVRYYGGASCEPWELRVYRRGC